MPASGTVLVGRDPTCDLPIDDGSVSRRHAEITIGSHVSVRDLGSANGTFVRQVSTTPYDEATGQSTGLTQVGETTVSLRPGATLHFGDVVAILQPADNPADEARGNRARVPSRDPSMQDLMSLADRVAQADTSVLILGETGVGKEVLASELHRRSPRASGPFVPVNCAALPAELIEAELFGHAKGAFTGASSARPGVFEAAHTGTLFLDELGELDLNAQAKLLRALDTRRITRLGERKAREVDVRVLGATNRDLAAEVEAGRFRSDLYFRLNGFPLRIPPLRERPRDIDDLLAAFLTDSGRDANDMDHEALELVRSHSWPGNVRELRTFAERLGILAASGPITAPLVAQALGSAPSSSPARPTPSTHGETLRESLEATERQRIVEALDSCGGNQTRAARVLGVSRKVLVARIEQFNLPRPRKKTAR